ncbi:cytochrome P450 4C1-like [Phymastichus coffea]|uniref:cytochrome P450 4C1-like n=1 Tax=Phymastichus coffea TaxID=108790 RepID=UPI00273C7F1C|nr:cytochrome P450 4C1-like [Phymastichus coffea]
MLFAILLSVVVVLCSFHYYIRYRRIGKYVSKLPGPRAWPLIGNLLTFLVPQDQLWYLVRKMGDNYYPIYKFWTLTEAIINLRHPDDVEVLLTSTQNISKSRIYELLEPWFRTGLLTSTGEKWRRRRKILTPAFHFTVLQQYLEIINENDERIVKQLRAEGESVQNILPIVSNYTLNVICETAMGTSLEGKKEFQVKYRNAVRLMGEILFHRLTKPWLKPDRLFAWFEKSRQQKEALKILHGFTSQIINEREEYHRKTGNKFLEKVNDSATDDEGSSSEEVFGIKKKRLAMLDLLIAAHHDGLIDKQGINEEVDTFMFEGHDTSAMGICFALLLLAEHKDVQERARAEVNQVLSESSGAISVTTIQRLNYLDRCVKESLRLYPSVPFISRIITHDMQLKNYLIPKDTIAHLHVYDTHRDPNFWPEPNKFDPDRFLPERIQKRHPFSYIPFSAGPRNCIGQKFAMMELKAVIAHLLHNFYLEPVDLAHEIPIITDLVIRPSRPIYMKFVSIQKDE